MDTPESVNKKTTKVTKQPKQEANFVINTPAYVPPYRFDDDSSDEERDGTFPEDLFGFDINTKEGYPFQAKTSGQEHRIVPEIQAQASNDESVIASPFLKKLEAQGFEPEDQDKIKTSVAAVIGLNRMLSLSTRKNKSLTLELQKQEDTNVRYEKLAFFWKCGWSDSSKKPVKYSKVRKFYKQLKHINPQKAQQFLEKAESGIEVPYQMLREYIKNHDKTKQLVKELRENNPKAPTYLSLIDGDTVDFNGIYSAYLRILSKYKTPPTVMSTGYEFPIDKKDGHVYKVGSEIDRGIRVITAKYVPTGVYYPDPNTCILIPKKFETLPESFIDKTIKQGNAESVAILREVAKRGGASFVFIDDSPIITTIPSRVKITKTHKTKIPFSSEFKAGASPTKPDIRYFKQMSQSHFNEKVWYDNLFIHNTIKIESDGSEIKHLKQHCKSLISALRNPNDNHEGIISELKKHINPQDVALIVKASKEVNKFIQTFSATHARTSDEQKLLNILQDNDIPIKGLLKEVIKLLSQEEILKLIGDEIIDIKEILTLDFSTIEEMFSSTKAIELLKNEDIEFVDLLSFYLYCKEIHKQDYQEALQDLSAAINNAEYNVEEILLLHCENPLHLKFMAGDPNEVAYDNLDDITLVEFGIKHYDVDIEQIIEELIKSKDDMHSADAMELLRELDYYNEDEVDYYNEDEVDYYDEDYKDEGSEVDPEVASLMGNLGFDELSD